MKRILALGGAIGIAMSLHMGAAGAAESAEQVYQRACSDCHMAFPPQLLPKRSWDRILSTLGDHFGEDASIDPRDMGPVKAYLDAFAADTGGGTARWALRGVKRSQTPLRITELPWWKAQHRWEVSQRAWKRAGSKANCTACHRAAAQGRYDDD